MTAKREDMDILERLLDDKNGVPRDRFDAAKEIMKLRDLLWTIRFYAKISQEVPDLSRDVNRDMGYEVLPVRDY